MHAANGFSAQTERLVKKMGDRAETGRPKGKSNMLNVIDRAPRAKLSKAAAPLNEQLDFIDWVQTMIAQCQTLHSAVRHITPVDARYILDCHNDRNRPIRPHKVATYSRILRAGDHMVTHQGISFARSGRLNNGQNRLAAICATGIPADLYVTFGEEDEAFNVIDASTMSKRSPGDILAVAGYPDAKTVAAISAMVLGRAPDLRQQLKKKTLGGHETLDFAEAHKGDLVDAAAEGRRVARALKCSAASVGYALYLIYERSAFVEENGNVNARDFVEALIDPDAHRDLVGYITPLRDGLLGQTLDLRHRSGQDRRYAVSASVIKCWNNIVKGKKKSIVLRLGEAFPVPA